MRYGHRFLAAVLAIAGITALARTDIVDIESSPVPSGLSMAQVEQGIVSGSLEGRWIAKVVAPGHIEARLSVRSHVAVVGIEFSESTYSIRYKDSHNLDYKSGRIHRNYNHWVANLNLAVQRVLVAASTASAVPGGDVPVARGPTEPSPAASAGVYSGETVAVAATIPFSIAVPQVAMECRIGEQLSQLMQASSPSIEIGAAPGAGHYLDASITELHMPGGGAWSGPKWLEVSGTLREGGGAAVASFRAKRFSTGGAFAVFKGNCQIVQRCVKAIAQDVAGWLRDPIDGAELGDAR